MNRNEENNKIRSVLAETSARLLDELCDCPSVVRIGIEVSKVVGFGDSEKTFCFAIRMPKKEVVIRESPTPKDNPQDVELKDGQEIRIFGKRLRYVKDDGSEETCLKCFFGYDSGFCDAMYDGKTPGMQKYVCQSGHFELIEEPTNKENENGRKEFDPDLDAHG